MNGNGGLKQPYLGIISTVISVFLALSIILWFDPAFFGSWFTFLIICAIPAQVILGLVWQSGYPPPAATLQQPFKGLYLTLLAIFCGCLIAPWALKIVPGFKLPGPGPVQNHFIIMTVATTLWLVIAWQCWPMSAIKPHPAFIGIGTFILAYVLTWVLFQIFWSFEVLAKAPFYVASSDPGGFFQFDKAMGFYIATVGVLLAMVLLDMWPLSSIAAKVPSLGKQPAWGIMMTIWVLIITWIIYALFVSAGGMDPTRFLVQVAVSWIFGEFIMLNLMQTAPFQTTKQPAKGLLLIVFTAILAVLMYWIYGGFCRLIAGALPAGPPAYAFELWIATAMLGVTFPMIVLFTGFFEFWPLTEPTPPPPPPEGAAANPGPGAGSAPAGPPPKDLKDSIDKYL